MTEPLVLASSSEIRARMLRQAGVPVEVAPVRIDEQTIRASLVAEGAGPRDVADTLAEMKARKGSEKLPSAWVMGCDQILDLDGSLLGKPETPEQAADHLRRLSGTRHQLLSAAVIYEAGQPIWRHVGVARLSVRTLTDGFITDYVGRNWDSIRVSLGGYKIEEEGVRLFSRIEGDHFTIQGLPLIELLSFLILRGKLES